MRIRLGATLRMEILQTTLIVQTTSVTYNSAFLMYVEVFQFDYILYPQIDILKRNFALFRPFVVVLFALK